MRRLAFYGASDDLLEIEVNGTVVDEILCYDTPIVVVVTDPRPEGFAHVVIEYKFGPHGWQVATWLPAEHDDGQPMIPLHISLSSAGYSQRVEVELDEKAIATFCKQHDVHVDKAGIFEHGKFTLVEGM